MIGKLLAANLISFVLLIIMGFMIYYDKPYWGWLLVCALICGKTLESKESKKP